MGCVGISIMAANRHSKYRKHHRPQMHQGPHPQMIVVQHIDATTRFLNCADGVACTCERVFSPMPMPCAESSLLGTDGTACLAVHQVQRGDGTGIIAAVCRPVDLETGVNRDPGEELVTGLLALQLPGGSLGP